MSELRLIDVSVAYGSRTALSGLDLTVRDGERVAVLGPNGAGKSSLLRAVTGVLPVSRGLVTLDGTPLAELGRETIAQRIAVVPQQVDLPFAIRVEEVVALGRIPHERSFRGPTAEDREIVDEAIHRVGLDGFVGRDARELSLGERQLVLIAMAVAQQARLLLLDEPTVHLDLRHQVQVMDLLADLDEREGLTILAVLHDLALAAHYFPRALLLDGGRLEADGAPAVVLAPERIRATFGVDAAVWMGGARTGV